jgi:hypothetical protein
MKKVVFSLVVFMAFSVSAFANTVEVKEEVVVLELQELVVSDTPCADEWVKNYNALRDAGFGMNTAFAIADLDFEDCMEETYGEE